MKHKPRLFLDLKSRKANTFSSRSRLINLSSGWRHFRLSNLLKGVLALAVFLYFVLGFAIAPNSQDRLAVASSDSSERAQLERELEELEKEIAVYSQTVAKYRREGNTLQSEVDRLDAKIAQLSAQIRAITLTLEKLSGEIVDTEGAIVSTESELEKTREAVASAIQYIHEKEEESLVVVLLKNPNLSDFFNELNDLLDVQNTLSEKIKEMTGLRDDLLEEKEILALKKSDAIALAEFQADQKQAVLGTKSEKDVLLEETRGKEAAYQSILSEKQKSAAEIRQRIFKLIGGGQMSFEEAYEFARYAENLTGTRAAFLLAILDKESSLGRNVGQCHYRTAMAPGPPTSRRDDITPFLKITAELGLDPEKTLVSCAISTDGAYGGAMGPSQFIPTTWMYYADKVSRLTGSNPANPWNNGDAFVATGLYVSDALNSCSSRGGVSQERCAAARYYAGGNWSTFEWTYGQRVIDRAAQFEEDIKVITS